MGKATAPVGYEIDHSVGRPTARGANTPCHPLPPPGEVLLVEVSHGRKDPVFAGPAKAIAVDIRIVLPAQGLLPRFDMEALLSRKSLEAIKNIENK
jgi:hypothetical protein